MEDRSITVYYGTNGVGTDTKTYKAKYGDVRLSMIYAGDADADYLDIEVGDKSYYTSYKITEESVVEKLSDHHRHQFKKAKEIMEHLFNGLLD